jgi:hypothetical protein
MRTNLLDLTYEGNYFFSDQNLGGDFSGGTAPAGEIYSLPNGQAYENFTNLFEVGYTTKSGFRFSGGGTFAYAHSRGQLEDRDNTEFGYIIGSVQYAVRKGSFTFIPAARVEYSIPRVENTVNNENRVMTNEAASGYEFGGWALWTAWRLRTHAYLAYRIQDEQRANLAKWAIGTRYFGSGFWIDGELNGQNVIVDDGDANIPVRRATRRAVVDTVNGGSYRYYTTNPEIINAEAAVGFHVNPDTAISGGFGHTLTGQNTAYGLTLFARITLNFDTDGYGKSGKSLTTPTKFMPSLEKYDESLFQED